MANKTEIHAVFLSFFVTRLEPSSAGSEFLKYYPRRLYNSDNKMMSCLRFTALLAIWRDVIGILMHRDLNFLAHALSKSPISRFPTGWDGPSENHVADGIKALTEGMITQVSATCGGIQNAIALSRYVDLPLERSISPSAGFRDFYHSVA